MPGRYSVETEWPGVFDTFMGRLLSLKGLKESQANFVRRMGISDDTFRMWKARRVVPSTALLLAIAMNLDISIDWLLGLRQTND